MVSGASPDNRWVTGSRLIDTVDEGVETLSRLPPEAASRLLMFDMVSRSDGQQCEGVEK